MAIFKTLAAVLLVGIVFSLAVSDMVIKHFECHVWAHEACCMLPTVWFLDLHSFQILSYVPGDQELGGEWPSPADRYIY